MYLIIPLWKDINIFQAKVFLWMAYLFIKIEKFGGPKFLMHGGSWSMIDIR